MEVEIATNMPAQDIQLLHMDFRTMSIGTDAMGRYTKFYARGKKNGDIITHKDDVMILFLQNFDYLSFPGGTIHRNPCPSGHRPPSREKYDCCWGEVFNIWKRGLSATE